MFDDPVSTWRRKRFGRHSHAGGHTRRSTRQSGFCQASSREVFRRGYQKVPQTENTIHLPRSPYGSAKAYADSMVKNLSAALWDLCLFRHSLSTMKARGEDLGFVTRKITSGAAKNKARLSPMNSMPRQPRHHEGLGLCRRLCPRDVVDVATTATGRLCSGNGHRRIPSANSARSRLDIWAWITVTM
jgi:hypothetical protein